MLDEKFFVTCHDSDRKVPTWVGHALSHEDIAAAVADRREGKFRFRPDPEIPRGQRAEMADYTNSSFDTAPVLDARSCAWASGGCLMLLWRNTSGFSCC